MQKLWDDTVAASSVTPLALRAYTSRLIGGNKGRHTSLKTARTMLQLAG